MKKHLALAMAGAAIMFGAGSANAAVDLHIDSVNSVYSSYTPTADLRINGSTIVNNALVTPQAFSGTFFGSAAAQFGATATNIFSYCVDIFHYSGAGDFQVVSLADYLNPTKANEIGYLISTEAGNSGKAYDAAIQLAIWELVYETNSDLDIRYNHFSARDRHGVSAITTNSLLSSAAAHASTSTPGLQLYVAKSLGSSRDCHDTKKQDLLFWTMAPVPEPATWAMMIVGMAAIGGMMRKDRRKTTVRFA